MCTEPSTDTGRRVLAIEDEEDVLFVLRLVLESAGGVVTPATSLAAARAAMAGPRLPNLVVLDLALPDGDGLGLAREIKASHRDLPLIVVSAADWRGSDQATSAPFDYFFLKPFDVDVLEAVVRQTFGDMPDRRRAGGGPCSGGRPRRRWGDPRG